MNTSTAWLSLRMRDIDRYRVLKNVLDHHLTQRHAAAQLGLSGRQVRRLCQRVQQEGPRGVVHRLRGRPSNHRLAPSLWDRAIQRLREPLYAGFGPTLANEKLNAVGIHLSTSSLRRGMVAAGLWKARTPSERYRAWRPRRACRGELIQLDGSLHPWFEDRGSACWLIAYVDDATSRVLYAEFVDAEDTLTLMRLTRTYLRVHGRPLAFYVDKDSIYKTTRRPTIDEELQELYPITQFRRAMEELGIQVICANSPQAKGRIERLFGTLQDRLVKELRLRGISTKPEGNRFLRAVYLPEHNAKFSIAPANTTNAHRPLLTTHRLAAILSLRTERTLANDWTLRFQNQFFQLDPDQPVRVRPHDTVLVEHRLDGSIHLRLKGHDLRFTGLPHRPDRPLALPRSPRAPAGPPRPSPWTPPADHPWRRFPACRTKAALRAHAAWVGEH